MSQKEPLRNCGDSRAQLNYSILKGGVSSQRRDAQHRFGQQLLQPSVLVLGALQPPGVRDPVLAAQLCRRDPRLMLLQHANDLVSVRFDDLIAHAA